MKLYLNLSLIIFSSAKSQLTSVKEDRVFVSVVNALPSICLRSLEFCLPFHAVQFVCLLGNSVVPPPHTQINFFQDIAYFLPKSPMVVSFPPIIKMGTATFYKFGLYLFIMKSPPLLSFILSFQVAIFHIICSSPLSPIHVGHCGLL